MSINTELRSKIYRRNVGAHLWVCPQGGTLGHPYKKCPMSANRYKLGRAGLRTRGFFGQEVRRAQPASVLGKLVLGLILAVLLAGGAWAGEGFEAPRPGRVFQFPRDHGAHPDYKTEWWYYVGHLKAASGESFGYQLTFFRVALRKPPPPGLKPRSAWTLNTVYFAHLALTDAARHTFAFREKAGRGALGLSGAAAGPHEGLDRRLAGWSCREKHFTSRPEDRGLGLDLVLKPLKPPALHGDGGYSRKSAESGAASYYYSLPRLDTQGTILRGRPQAGGNRHELDGPRVFHQRHGPRLWSGWDWFSLQLADGWEVMLYLLRQKDGTVDPASSGTLIDPQGHTRHLKLSDFQVKPTGAWTSPHTQAKYPAGWEITIPGAGYRLRLTPTLPDQEIRAQVPAQVTYWEG